MGSAHGHTGHVRFLTSIELPEGFDMNLRPTTADSTGSYWFFWGGSTSKHFTKVLSSRAFLWALIPPFCFLGNQSQSGSTVDGNLQRRDSARRRASAHIPPKTNHLVISGGDGYEDFRLTNSSETVGRDDSTNHLLLWRVWDNWPLVQTTCPDLPLAENGTQAPVLYLPPDSSLFGVVVFGLLLSPPVSMCIIWLSAPSWTY